MQTNVSSPCQDMLRSRFIQDTYHLVSFESKPACSSCMRMFVTN